MSMVGVGLQDSRVQFSPYRCVGAGAELWGNLRRKNYDILAKPDNMLTKGGPTSAMDKKIQTYSRYGVGKMIHMSQLDIYSICGITSHIHQANPAYSAYPQS